jgi:hypothetical protein
MCVVFAGETVYMDLSSTRQLQLSSLTVQDGGQLDFVSRPGDTTDQWTLTVYTFLISTHKHTLGVEFRLGE